MPIRSLGFLLMAAASWACQAKPPEKPAGDLDPRDPKSLAGHAIYNTRTRSYRAAFTARLAAPQGDPIDYRGTSLRIYPGVLYIHYTATGGDLKNIVRVDPAGGPPSVWVWHEGLGDWVTPEEIGSPGIGRGIQNPDEVLDVLSRNLEGARLKEPGVVALEFAGEAIERVMKDQARKDAFDWKRSNASFEFHADARTRLKKLVCRASLQSADPNVQGVVAYSAEVRVESFEPEREMKFFDEDRKEIRLREDIRKAIAGTLKEKD